MEKLTALFALLAFLMNAQAQTFTSFFTGDTANVTTGHQPGIVLAGGGGDNDEAMQWMLERADGGDLVVIRASGSDGYNEYFFAELGVNVNSVETILFHAADAASDPYVISQIENAEVLFIAGGDQYDYYQFWKDNAVEEAINFLINEKMVTVGGTSAGMAILGNAYYTPSGGSATSTQLLGNPFHPNADILGLNDFLDNPYLPALVTDTHYDQRNRAGRHVAFMARLAAEHGIRTFGIACNEYTAVCIDGDGIGRVFGEHPDYPDHAYFLAANCQDEFLPEVLEEDAPLTWKRHQAAVKVTRIPGLIDGSNSFDVTNWQLVNGGEHFDWYVEQGELTQVSGADPACDAFVISSVEGQFGEWQIGISPNPASESLLVDIQEITNSEMRYEIFSSFGKLIRTGTFAEGKNRVDVSAFAAGSYWVKVWQGEEFGAVRFVKF